MPSLFPKTNANKVAWGFFICYALGLLHILLYPLVTFSTGEFKPRGTYFEENALQPSITQPRFVWEHARNQHESCADFEAEGFPCFEPRAALRWSLLRPNFYDDGKEVLVLVVTSTAISRSKLLAPFLAHLRKGRWLSKTIVVLMPARASSPDAVIKARHQFFSCC